MDTPRIEARYVGPDKTETWEFDVVEPSTLSVWSSDGSLSLLIVVSFKRGNVGLIGGEVSAQFVTPTAVEPGRITLALRNDSLASKRVQPIVVPK